MVVAVGIAAVGDRIHKELVHGGDVSSEQIPNQHWYKEFVCELF